MFKIKLEEKLVERVERVEQLIKHILLCIILNIGSGTNQRTFDSSKRY